MHDGISNSHRRLIQALAVAVTTEDGVNRVLVHGPTGPNSPVTVRRSGVDVTLPPASIINTSPEYDCVAWDGCQYVLCDWLIDIIEQSKPLEYVANIIPIEMLGVATGLNPSALYAELMVSEIERREKLLVAYKEATGNPSNKRIYEAENCPIHKPEFSKWRRGILPSHSQTTINFERFLSEKKPPRRTGR